MHTMLMIREHEGMEEWHCPTCGRHLLVNWKPKFRRTVIQAGDPNVSHNGFRNDLQNGHMRASSVRDMQAETPIDESRLTPWEVWLKNTGFDDLWTSDIQ